ncbi:MAG: M1 family metallopeptidase [Anaerolineales bacterium]|nr:M1 family metallopeptidase [Anaerolineales bacterium]
MRRRGIFFLIFSLMLLTGCVTNNVEDTPSAPTAIDVVDSKITGYAYLDSNNNTQFDDDDLPISGAQFTVTDAGGVTSNGFTGADGCATIEWQSERQYPLTVNMTPPQGYVVITSDELVLEQGSSSAKFLFKSNTHAPNWDPTPYTNEESSGEIVSANTLYTLTAVLNYGAHFVAVDEQIFYTNRSTDKIGEILLVVEPQRYNGVFSLNGISLGDGSSITPAWDDSWLKLPLDKPLEPGQNLQLSISYELNLPYPQPSEIVRPVPFGYTERQVNLVDWYPFIPPYKSGQGWMTQKPGYFGEHLTYEYADFQVNITVSDVPVASFVDANTLGDEPVIGYAIAASSPPQIDNEWRRYTFESARCFVWSVSHAYQVLSKKVGDITVLGYSFPVHNIAGQTALDVTAQSLDLYQQIYAPYPHDTLSVVEADFLDGMEYDGLYFLSNGFYNLYTGTPADYLTDIAAHETAHQWFFGMVGNDQGLEPWLDESLCTYTERIYYENFSPEGLDWWWEYRINYYKPTGYIDGSIFSYNYTANAYEAYRNAVYLNGAMFIEDLRNLIGDEAFFAFMKDYVSQNKGKITTTTTFFDILNQHTQADYSALKKKYFQK